nr:TIGR03089 family protein [Nocardioides sp.]
MTTFSTVLRDQLARDAGRPLVTFYGETPGERIELSVTTYANWVAKAAGLLVEECDLERGQSLRIDLPTHWLGPVFLGAAWTIGLVVTTDDAPDAVICGPETLADWADRADDLPVLACSLLPLGGRFAEGVPPGVHDVGAEIWGQPDAFTAWDPPGPDDRATDVLTQAELFAPTRGTAAVGSSLT